jgi:hypothetical protein
MVYYLNMSTIKSNDWNNQVLPKLKSRLEASDNPQNYYKTNAIGIQVNGSTVTLGLLNHLDELIQIEVLKKPGANKLEREKALLNLFNMVADIVKYQKSQDPNGTIDIDISAAGLAPKAHPNFFRAKNLEPVNIDGLTFMDNFPVETIDSQVGSLTGKYEKDKFHNFQARLMTALGDNRTGIKVNYKDEASEFSTNPSGSFTINMTTMNDTNSLAFQLGDQLNSGDTVIGLVGGTGFNVGVNKNYNGEGRFESISNLEAGGTRIQKNHLAKFLTPIEKLILESEPDSRPERFFASGSNNDYSLAGIVSKIKELTEANNYSEIFAYLNKIKTDQSIELSIPEWVEKSNKLSNQEIMNKAQEHDELALAMVNDFASRWGGFIKNRLNAQGLLNGVNNPKYAYTGSHLRHLLEITSAREAFARALGVHSDNLIKIEKSEMDGMQAILKAKIATARAAV